MSKEYRDFRSEMEPDVFELEEKRIAKEKEPEPLQDFESLFVKDEDFVPLNSLNGENEIDYRNELEQLM